MMQSHVARKMEESGNRRIDKWRDENAAALLAEMLV